MSHICRYNTCYYLLTHSGLRLAHSDSESFISFLIVARRNTTIWPKVGKMGVGQIEVGKQVLQDKPCVMDLLV